MCLLTHIGSCGKDVTVLFTACLTATYRVTTYISISKQKTVFALDCFVGGIGE